VLQLEGSHTSPGGLNPDLSAWRRDPAESPAGGMAALGLHEVDTFNYFVGPASRVFAFSGKPAALGTLDEATTVVIEYERGTLGYIGTTYFAPPIVTVAAYGTKGNAWNEQDGERLFVQPIGEAARNEQPVDTIDTVVDEVTEFARCIREGGTPETGGPEAVEVAAVMEATLRSVTAGRAVDVADLR
jgi:predicted dehydrogenase